MEPVLAIGLEPGDHGMHLHAFGGLCESHASGRFVPGGGLQGRHGSDPIGRQRLARRQQKNGGNENGKAQVTSGHRDLLTRGEDAGSTTCSYYGRRAVQRVSGKLRAALAMRPVASRK
jgi:hypothetical protein